MDQYNTNDVLKQISQYLDISPSDFKQAQKRFNAVGDWLCAGNYNSGSQPEIYLQGSFRLGTVVRPYFKDKDGDFDIDLVCEISNPNQTKFPSILKNDIGNRLKDNNDYGRMLDDEGKRCWRIEYSSTENHAGFHLDILPAIPSVESEKYQIDITHKEVNSYSWKTSNPKGYYNWFKANNFISEDYIREQSEELFKSNRHLYIGEHEVPKQLIRTPLQRAIQIMKRHRDIHFLNMDFKPISIIITTITTQVRNQDTIEGVIKDFINYVLNRHEELVKNETLVNDGILDYCNNQWKILNPVYSNSENKNIENFADKWNKNKMIPISFFEWVYQLKRDLYNFSYSSNSDDLNLKVKRFGNEVSSVSRIKQELDLNPKSFDNLLNLIHLGIEKKFDWESIKKFSQSNADNATSKESRSIAKINFYQVAMHRKVGLSTSAIEDVKQIRLEYNESAAFRMCCDLLLGSITSKVVKDCIIAGRYSNILEWPIIRLAPYHALYPIQTEGKK